MSVLALAGVACGAESSSTEQGSSSGSSGKRAAPGGGGASERDDRRENDSEEAELARTGVGKKEITNMIPADGKPDTARPLPEDPPRGIEVYPATNRSVKGLVEYDREPPTNGDHAPIWQNCGLYEKPVQNRYAVHSLDHGVVWITYRPAAGGRWTSCALRRGGLRDRQPVPRPGRARYRHLLEGPVEAGRRGRPASPQVRRPVQGLRARSPLRQPLRRRRRPSGRLIRPIRQAVGSRGSAGPAHRRCISDELPAVPLCNVVVPSVMYVGAVPHVFFSPLECTTLMENLVGGPAPGVCSHLGAPPGRYRLMAG